VIFLQWGFWFAIGNVSNKGIGMIIRQSGFRNSSPVLGTASFICLISRIPFI
jgi:hypothetical protein